MPIPQLLDFLYNEFAVTFILCIIGVVTKEFVVNVRKNKKFDKLKMTSAVILSSLIMCAVQFNLKLEYHVYIVCCVIGGGWSTYIASFVWGKKFMSESVPKLLRTMATPLAKALADIIEDSSKNDKNKKNKDGT